MKTKSILLIFLSSAILQKTMAQNLNPDKSIRITKKDVDNHDAEINLLTLSAAGIFIGMTKRYINKTYVDTPKCDEYNNKINNYILGPLFSIISLQYKQTNDTTNLSVFASSIVVGLIPDLLCGASKGLILGRIIGSTADELVNNPSDPDKFDSLCMKSGAIIGAMFEMEKDPILNKIAIGATSCWLTYCLSRKLKKSQG